MSSVRPERFVCGPSPRVCPYPTQQGLPCQRNLQLKEIREAQLHQRHVRSAVLGRGFQVACVPDWLVDMDHTTIGELQLVLIPLAQKDTLQTNPIYRTAPANDAWPQLNGIAYAVHPLSLQEVIVVSAYGRRFTVGKVRYHDDNFDGDAYINIHSESPSHGYSVIYCGLGSDCDEGLDFLKDKCLCGGCFHDWTSRGWTCQYIQRKMPIHASEDVLADTALGQTTSNALCLKVSNAGLSKPLVLRLEKTDTLNYLHQRLGEKLGIPPEVILVDWGLPPAVPTGLYDPLLGLFTTADAHDITYHRLEAPSRYDKVDLCSSCGLLRHVFRSYSEDATHDRQSAAVMCVACGRRFSHSWQEESLAVSQIPALPISPTQVVPEAYRRPPSSLVKASTSHSRWRRLGELEVFRYDMTSGCNVTVSTPGYIVHAEQAAPSAASAPESLYSSWFMAHSDLDHGNFPLDHSLHSLWLGRLAADYAFQLHGAHLSSWCRCVHYGYLES